MSRVEIKPGDSLILSGLIDRRVTRNLTKFPFLGDIPILGALFRSTNFENQDSELIFVVTPRIVNASPEKPKLPDLDRYDSPDMRQIPLASRPKTKPMQLASTR